MKATRTLIKKSSLLSLMIILLATTPVALAQSDAGYELDWWTVDGGGVIKQAGANGYSLNGTSGQPDAAVWSNGHYTLSGGFWFVSAAAGYEVFLPVVMRRVP